MQPDQPSSSSGKVPATLQKEIRAKLASLNIKLTLVAEQLKAESNPDRVKELRDQLFELKAEAQAAVEKYRWAQQLYAAEASSSPSAPSGGTDEPLDGLLIFGDLDLTSPPPADMLKAAAGRPFDASYRARPEIDDVAVVFDLETVGAPVGPSPIDTAGETPDVFGALTYSLDLDEPSSDPAVGRPTVNARGGRIGQALAYAVAASQAAGVALAAPLAAASLAIEGGADEDATIAAALHDVGEGPGGSDRQQAVSDEFGPSVAGLLEWCQWMKQIDPWEQRDRGWLSHLQTAPPDAFLVSICYRIATLSAIERARRALGIEALGDSDKHRERFFWCQRAMLKAYKSKARGPLVDEWQRLVDELELGSSGKVSG